jgi:NAD(P)-dependent dehydrogenase (short-subunit alcohol dehydrogenase family)
MFADGTLEAIAEDLKTLEGGGSAQAATQAVKASSDPDSQKNKITETVSQDQKSGCSGMRFKGKKAVVVGGAEGSIGQAIAFGLGAEGAQVCIWDINVESAEKTAKQIADAGGQAKVMKVNALHYDDVKGAVARTIKQFGGIDFMVDTVGGGVFKSFKEYTPEFFKQQLEFNGVTVFNCAHNILPHFVEKNAGKMVFFTSATGGTAGLAGYQTGKAVLESLVKTMVAEVAKTKININAVLPGIVPTPLTLGAFKAMGMDGEKTLAGMAKQNPRGLNSTENVAGVVLFLLSAEADRLTGQIITMS